VELKENSVDNTLKNILTLRYDPSQTSTLPNLSAKDYSSKINLDEIYIEKDIHSYLDEHLVQKTNSLGIALSGGIDSTLVLHSIKKIYPEMKVNAFSIRFSNSVDETSIAKKIADYFDVEHNIIDLDNYLQDLPRAISITRLPFWDIHWFYVAQESQKKSKYLASGDGGDELFGGYTFRYKKFLSLINSKSSPVEKTQAYLQCHERDHVPDQHKIFSKNIDFSWDKFHQLLLPYFENDLSQLDQLFLADYNGKLLYNFSIVNNAINKEFDVKSITPILNTSFLKSTSHLNDFEKYDAKTNLGKLPLRKILQKSEVYKLLSPEKLGFSVNTQNLWKNYGKKISSYFLSDSQLVKDNLINNDWIQSYINSDNLDVRYINKLLGLLACEIWYRIFVIKNMKSTEKLIF